MYLTFEYRMWITSTSQMQEMKQQMHKMKVLLFYKGLGRNYDWFFSLVPGALKIWTCTHGTNSWFLFIWDNLLQYHYCKCYICSSCHLPISSETSGSGMQLVSCSWYLTSPLISQRKPNEYSPLRKRCSFLQGQKTALIQILVLYLFIF